MSLQDGFGCWAWVGLEDPSSRGALFLDRDGVIVEEVNYLCRVEDVRLLPGAAETIRAANRARVPVVVVTNQSGVARGRFGWSEFEAVQARMTALLAAEGARLDAVFACGYHETGRGELGAPDHGWRKPNPGMLLAAAQRTGVILGRSLIVGDRAADLAAGRNAGLRCGVHIATGHGDEQERAAARELARDDFEVRLVSGLGEVAHTIGMFYPPPSPGVEVNS